MLFNNNAELYRIFNVDDIKPLKASILLYCIILLLIILKEAIFLQTPIS